MNRYVPIGLLMCAIASGVAFFRQDQHDQHHDGAIEMSDRLRGDYEKMLKEHQQIQEALRALATAAEQEHHPEHAAFAHNLMAHAQNEEQVLYPATLLIGQYLKLRHGDVEKAGAPHPEVR